MPTQPETPSENDDPSLIDIPLNIADVDDFLANNQGLEESRQAQEESALMFSQSYEKKNKEQQLKEKEQTHEIRKTHLGRLFLLTFAWVVIIWIVIFLQGFGQVPLLHFFGLKSLPFKLSDTVIVAFMTTTTTTVLGLYGIAAYWLYGGKKTTSESDEKEE